MRNLFRLVIISLLISSQAFGAIKFAYRSSSDTNFIARYTNSGSTPNLWSSYLPTQVVDATAIGGYKTSMLVKFLTFVGHGNVGTNQGMSVLMRFAPAWSGIFANAMGFFKIGYGSIGTGQNLGIFALGMAGGSTGNVTGYMTNDTTGGIGINNTTMKAAWSPTANQYYDFVVTTVGTTGASSFILYIDGAQQVAATPTQAFTNPRPSTPSYSIEIGGYPTYFSNNYYLNEFVVWDTVLTATAGTLDPVTLTSGSGPLNGSARSAFVSVNSFQGDVSTDPGIGTVSNGTVYQINGVALTGTAAIPGASDVRFGTSTGATTGSLRVPARTDVRFGSLTDNTTGLAYIAANSDVRFGVNNDAGTGTCYVPSPVFVASGVPVDATTGSLTVPTVTQIVNGVLDADVSTHHTTAGTAGAQLNATALASVLGAPVGASISADIAATKTAVLAIPTAPLLAASYTAPDNATISNIYTRLGVPVGASVSADIASLATILAGVPTAAQNATAVRTNLTTELGYLNAPVNACSTATQASQILGLVSAGL